MESNSLDHVDENRACVLGCTTDQGTERKVADGSVHILKHYDRFFAPADTRSWMYPACLFVAGHLHILYNGLEEACKLLQISNWFFRCLQTLCDFLSCRDLRRTLMAVCLKDSDCGLFAHFPVTHIDWRWETLGPALARVASLLQTLRQAYDLENDSDRFL